MSKLYLIAKATKEVFWEKDLDRISAIETKGRDIVIRYPNGLHECYFKSKVDMLIK